MFNTKGGQADELINLTHSGVIVSGYNAHQKRGTKAHSQLPWTLVTGNLNVQVTGQDEGKTKGRAGLYITKKPKQTI